MTQNTQMIDVKIEKTEAPYGAEARHEWAVMLNGKRVARIIPMFTYDFANALSTASAKRTAVGYSLNRVNGTLIKSFDVRHDAIDGRVDGKHTSIRVAFNHMCAEAFAFAAKRAR